MLGDAFNLNAWIDAHRHLLKPPVGNKCIVAGDYIVDCQRLTNTHMCFYARDSIAGPDGKPDGRDFRVRKCDLPSLHGCATGKDN